MPDEKKPEPGILYDFGPPPAWRYAGPVIDAHLHVGEVETARPMVEAARAYGVVHALGITRLANLEPAQRAFGDFFTYAVSLDYEHADDGGTLLADCRAILAEAHGRGVRMVKFWFKPQFTAEKRLTLDDPRLRPVFDLIGDLGMACVVHVADPDVWWKTHYADIGKFGAKADHFRQLETLLREHRNITVQGAHLGGDPERLDHLRQLLADHPNLCLDTSATKWVVRELGRQPEAARAFFIDHADRLLFGTDLVPRKEPHPLHYASRYWALRMLLETDGRRPSPIHDPDADGPVDIVGLGLPDGVLRRVYLENACRVLGLGCRSSGA